MNHLLLGSTALLALGACAQPSTTVMPPYTLANGHTYQDVTSVATDGTGLSPVVTQINTYTVDPEHHEGGGEHLVSTHAGSQAGVINAVAASVGQGIVGGIVANALADNEADTQCPPNQMGTPPNCYFPNSDRRLKTDIVRIGQLDNGIAIYQFRYVQVEGFDGTLDTETVFVGVMAQDLLETHPTAVLVGADGFYRVDYNQIGFAMTTLAEWQAANAAPLSYRNVLAMAA